MTLKKTLNLNEYFNFLNEYFAIFNLKNIQRKLIKGDNFKL